MAPPHPGPHGGGGGGPHGSGAPPGAPRRQRWPSRFGRPQMLRMSCMMLKMFLKKACLDVVLVALFFVGNGVGTSAQLVGQGHLPKL